MNKNALRSVLIPLLIIGAVSLACGISNPIKEPEIVSTAAALAPTLEAAVTKVAPTLEAVVEDLAPTIAAAAATLIPGAEAVVTALPIPALPTPGGEIDEFLSQLQGSGGLSGLDSFRQTAVLDFQDGEQSGKVDYWGEFTTSPQATHGRVTLSGLASAGLPLPTFEYIVIEGEAWVKIGLLPWQNIPEGVETITGQQPYSADSFLLAAPAAQRVMPDQTVNGIECKHYVYSKDDLSFEGGSFETASGEIFTAVDGGYVVRYTLYGVGTLNNFFAGQTGTINLVYDLSDVNTDLAIEPPG